MPDKGHPPRLTPLRNATSFRVASSSASQIHTRSDLEEQLRRRLRVKSAIWAAVTALLGATAVYGHLPDLRADPMGLFNKPPLPGILFLMSVGTLVLIRLLSPARHLTLRALRVIEWCGLMIIVAFFLINQTIDLRTGMLNHILRNPMNLGAGLGAPWAMIAVGYGVLVPASGRHSLARTAVIALCAFLPEILAIPASTGFPLTLRTYLAVKLLVVASMCALAIYGAYRIEVLRQASDEARRLGQYVLRTRIGEGGMGEVYLAEHQLLRRPCAVKLIRPEQAGDESTLARFEREVQAAAGLTHPNTVQIFDYGRAEDGTFYYAMEYLPGISLEELVDRHGVQSPERAIHILVQLCGALGEAHLAGLVHRDLKPGNVMLCERGGVYDVVKLLDYGLVVDRRDRHVDPRLTQSGIIVGTPAYMSPEQCDGVDDITPASDIYSLGALTWFLLAGTPPFGSRSAMQMLAAHLHEKPAMLDTVQPGVPVALALVVARCLEKAVEARFADVHDLEAALRVAVRPTWTNADAREWWHIRERPTLADDRIRVPASLA